MALMVASLESVYMRDNRTFNISLTHITEDIIGTETMVDLKTREASVIFDEEGCVMRDKFYCKPCFLSGRNPFNCGSKHKVNMNKDSRFIEI